MTRTIVQIDEDKCNGCGVCIPHCHEGAIQIIEGKAKLVADKLCDGFGDCLGKCPLDAITLIEREADEFDEEAVQQQMTARKQTPACPGLRALDLDTIDENPQQETSSALTNWPVQLELLTPNAPYFKDCDLLIAADCVAFAHPNFHRGLQKDKVVAIGCPKLDDNQEHLAKLTAIIGRNSINSITVAHMEVPCCSGLVSLVRQALKQAEKDIPVKEIMVGMDGQERPV